jgi:hypothetical protein
VGAGNLHGKPFKPGPACGRRLDRAPQAVVGERPRPGPAGGERGGGIVLERVDAAQMSIIRAMRSSMNFSVASTFAMRWPARSWKLQASKMRITWSRMSCASARSCSRLIAAESVLAASSRSSAVARTCWIARSQREPLLNHSAEPILNHNVARFTQNKP